MSKELENNFPNSQSLISREAYDFYRKNRKAPAKQIDDYTLYKKAMSGLFRVIGDMMIESEGGVYIDGFGYLCNIAYPNEWKTIGQQPKSLFQRLKKYQHYFPYYIPDVEFKAFTMSEAFESQLVRKIHAQDIKYKLHFDLVESMRIAHDVILKHHNHRRIKGEFDYRGRLLKKINK